MIKENEMLLALFAKHWNGEMNIYPPKKFSSNQIRSMRKILQKLKVDIPFFAEMTDHPELDSESEYAL